MLLKQSVRTSCTCRILLSELAKKHTLQGINNHKQKCKFEKNKSKGTKN